MKEITYSSLFRVKSRDEFKAFFNTVYSYGKLLLITDINDPNLFGFICYGAISGVVSEVCDGIYDDFIEGLQRCLDDDEEATIIYCTNKDAIPVVVEVVSPTTYKRNPELRLLTGPGY